MHEKKFTIFGSHATKSAVERAAEIIFTACGLLAVVAVFSITLYMIISGTPALFKVVFRKSYLEPSGSRLEIRRLSEFSMLF